VRTPSAQKPVVCGVLVRVHSPLVGAKLPAKELISVLLRPCPQQWRRWVRPVRKQLQTRWFRREALPACYPADARLAAGRRNA
jgi:hypothetical protein